MKRYYNVAGHVFALEMKSGSPLWNRLTQYLPFRVHFGFNPVFTLSVVDKLEVDQSSVLYDQPTDPGETKIKLFNCADGRILCETSVTSERPVAGRLLLDKDFRKGRLKIEADGLFAVNNALMLMYAFSTAGKGTLEMHASVIRQDGKGYLFLAKSGTGKSTQSQMWLRAVRGSELLNDDNPIVRFKDGKAIVYGSPWSGKTPCYRNESCPVGAFVKIHRAPENSIRELGVLEAYSNIYSSSSGFKFNDAMADNLNDTFSKLIENTRSFELSCLPNEDAALVCAKGVGANLDVRSIILPNDILLGDVKEQLQQGRQTEFLTKGCSMLPFIYGNYDSIRLEGYNDSVRPQVDDIALAEISKGNYVLHRIDALDESMATLRGDGNLRGREYCRPVHLLGRAVAIVRADGKIVDCTSKCFHARVAVWKALPVIVKRCIIAFIRRYRKYIVRKPL